MSIGRLLVVILVLAISHWPFAISSSHAKETDSEVPLAGINASLQPDLFTGTLTGSIPIEVPPGRNDMQPNLVLSYASSGGNSWTGMGWKLEMGTIERQTKWGVLYSPTTQDELDGKVYTMRLNGVSADLVRDATVTNRYYAKVEQSWARITKLATGWEVTDTKGTKYTFGTITATRTADPADATKIFRWYLERVEDRDGNYMTLVYTSDQGQNYLSQINYAGNSVTGAATTNTVKFYAENRTDAPDLYTSNFKIKMGKRLTTIDIQANGQRVRAYSLSYVASPTTTRSLLATVRRHGKDANVDQITGAIVSSGTALPPVTSTWTTNATAAFTQASYALNSGFSPSQYANQQWVPADVNGDGKTDLVWAWHAGDQLGRVVFQANATGTGFTQASYVLDTSYFPSQYGNQQWLPVDVNADGKTDLVWVWTFGNQVGRVVYLANAAGTGFTQASYVLDSSYVPTQYTNKRWISVDVNGDGKTDLVWVWNFGNQVGRVVLLANAAGTGFTQASYNLNSGFSPSQYANQQWVPMDVNGDGKTDLVWAWHAADQLGRVVFLANAAGTDFTQASYVLDGGFVPSQYANQHWLSTDVNGDAKGDLVWAWNFGNQLGMVVYQADAAGTGVTQVSYTLNSGFSPSQYANQDWIPVDANGDGKSDLVWVWRAGDQVGRVVLQASAAGTGFTQVSYDLQSGFVPSQYTNQQWVSTDVNGDAKGDLAWVWNSGNQFGIVTYVTTTPGLLPDHLQTIANGLSGATTVQYLPSTQYVNTQLPYPIQTVSGVTTCDNWNGTSCAGLSSTTTYAYDGGFHNLQYRDFRGFKHATVTGPTGPNGERTTTETWFHQGTNLSKSDDSLTNLQTAPVAFTAGLPWKVEVKNEAGTLQSRTQTGYHNILGSTSAPFLPKVLNTLNETCQGACTKQVLSEFNYNTTGGLTHEWHSGDTSTASDNRTIIHTLSSNTTDWILNVPIKDEVYRGVAAYGDTPVLMAQTDSYYDGTTSCATASTNQIPTKGHLTRTVRAFFNGTSTHAAPETRMAYDSYGNVTCTRDANGNTSTVTYDSATNTFPLTSTSASPASLTTSTSYYGVNGVAIPATGFYGQVQSVTDPNGRVTTHEYDALGRRTKTTNPDGFFATTTYNYGVGQTVGTQHVLITNSLGHSSASYFDGLGRGTRKTSTYTAGATRETKTEYNARGQVLRTSLPYFTGGTIYWQTLQYDALGRVKQVTNADNTTSKSCYSDWTTVSIEPDGDRKRETKDSFGRVVKIEEYNSTFASCDTTVGTPYATTIYSYDVLGNLLSVTDAKGNVSTMAYDSLNRKKSMHDPDMGDWSYLYDANGNLTKQTDAKGQVLWFTYDSLNRPVQKDFGGTAPKALGSGDVRYTFDDTVTTFNRKGRLKQVVDAATNVTFEYDVMGRITKSTKVLDGTTYITTSGYDGLGRLSTVTYPANPNTTPATVATTVTSTYEGPYLKQVTEGTVTYVQYAGWNETGQPATATYNVGTNQVTTTYTYQTASNATCGSKHTFRPCTTKVQKGTTPAYLDLRYAFTNGGNVNNIFDQLLPANDQTYIYDPLDRLTSANGPYGASGINATLTYAYDQIGNMTTNSQVGTYTYPTSGATSVRPHAVSSAGLNAYVYDNNGNLTSGAGRIFEWNLENKPTCIAQAAGTCSAAANKTTFVYDGDGGRLKKITSATTTRYISKLYECDTTGASTTCSRFIWAGSQRVATVASNGTTHFWHQDHLGSSTIITDSTGAKAQALSYFPYGATRTNQSFTTPPVNVPYKYTGKELDSTGLYYYEARYYDPTLGRFISPDTVVPSHNDPQSLNRYSYVRNNPLLYTDPTGHFFKGFVKFFKGVGKALEAGFYLTNPFAFIARTMYEYSNQPGKWFSPTAQYDLMRTFRHQFYAGHADVLEATGLQLPARGLRELTKFENTRTGRYIEAGAMVAGLGIGAAFCGGCTAPAIGALMGGFVGAASGFAQAAYAGVDPLHATVSGGAYGAAGGAIGGAFTQYAAPFLLSRASDSMWMVHLSLFISEEGLSKFAGSVVGSSFSGGFTAISKRENVGNGFGFGALGGAFGGAMAIGPAGKVLDKLLGETGSFGVYGVRIHTRDFADGAVDWTGGWSADQTK